MRNSEMVQVLMSDMLNVLEDQEGVPAITWSTASFRALALRARRSRMAKRAVQHQKKKTHLDGEQQQLRHILQPSHSGAVEVLPQLPTASLNPQALTDKRIHLDKALWSASRPPRYQRNQVKRISRKPMKGPRSFRKPWDPAKAAAIRTWVARLMPPEYIIQSPAVLAVPWPSSSDQNLMLPHGTSALPAMWPSVQKVPKGHIMSSAWTALSAIKSRQQQPLSAEPAAVASDEEVRVVPGGGEAAASLPPWHHQGFWGSPEQLDMQCHDIGMYNALSQDSAAYTAPLLMNPVNGLHQTFHGNQGHYGNTSFLQQHLVQGQRCSQSDASEFSHDANMTLNPQLPYKPLSHHEVTIIKEVLPILDQGAKKTDLGGTAETDFREGAFTPTDIFRVAQDVSGREELPQADETFLLFQKLRLCSSSALRSALERWLACLDADTKANVQEAWRSEVNALDPDAVSLPDLPVLIQQAAAIPQGTRPVNSPPKKKARVLREGQLSLIVFGFDERLQWARRVGCFIRSMRSVLGDRSLQCRWGGSVLDSVIGTFLTQNASDVLSSRAFISLAARFPSKRYVKGLALLSGQQHNLTLIGDKMTGLFEGSGSEEVAIINIDDEGDRGVQEVPVHSTDTNKYGLGVGEDIVDWVSVLRADPAELCESIRCRGMYHLLTGRIQKFLVLLKEQAVSAGQYSQVLPTQDVVGGSKPGEAAVAVAVVGGPKPGEKAAAAVAECEAIASAGIERASVDDLEGLAGCIIGVNADVAQATGVEPPAHLVTGTRQSCKENDGFSHAASIENAVSDVADDIQATNKDTEGCAAQGISQDCQTEGIQIAEEVGVVAEEVDVLAEEVNMDAADRKPHYRLSLEWLREAGEERASAYLMNVAGLGRKSTG
ncbi:hypothetical protein CEUSTIGMA_g638.t1 [Chlamydomonas eustigma]|uniref:Uncharacterized protein n=1 Tax=Chlamydomonas eustigma TaxID=1157962 RepID=A0A250WQR1_9CHLO|nr:hypothetical protein CEUSTIGMA_g638.t1 [Chlamydomonas eustigma]|eukprot:GAX73185.1 hypothetical protein CEUSTIGMA_g638.t1 [Chlamydomonas eustigma]